MGGLVSLVKQGQLAGGGGAGAGHGPLRRDTDGDGQTDLAEVLYWGDPLDAVQTVRGLYAEVAERVDVEVPLVVPAYSPSIDVAVVVDVSASLDAYRPDIVQIIPLLDAELRRRWHDPSMALTTFSDYLTLLMSYPNDRPFRLVSPTTTDVSRLVDGLTNAVQETGQWDYADSAWEGVWHTLTGTGWDYTWVWSRRRGRSRGRRRPTRW
jgi:hypothetical protein